MVHDAVAGDDSIGRTILSYLSVVTPLLAAVKSLKALLPINSSTGSTPVEPQTISDVAVRAEPGKWFTRLWWVAFLMSVVSLKTRQVRTWRLGQLMDAARVVPMLGWLPSGYYTIPVRTAAMVVLFTLFGKWAVSVVIDKVSSPIGAKWTTRFIRRSLTASALSSSQQRQVFVDLPLVSAKVQVNHTHGAAARDRNTSSATSALAARALGLEPYYVQQSLADTRKARAGDRSFHWAKDLAIPPKEFSFNPLTHAAVLVDVDHYVNMPMLLAQKPGTYFVCTFQPTACAESVGEYSFRFLSDGRVSYRVSGGAEYVHEVWDYSGDTLLVEESGFLLKQVSAYHVDRKRIDDHHVVVMLSLIGQFTTMAALPTSLLIEGKQLKRFNPVFGKHVVLDVVKAEGLYRSIAVVGDFSAVTLPRAQLDAVHAVALVAKVPVTPAMVASNIMPSSPAGLPTERLPPGHAAIIAGYTRAGVPEFPPVVYPPSQSLLPISFDKHDYDAPVALAGFGSPLVGPSYGFVNSIASDDQCIAGRVEAFQDYVEEPIPPTLAGYMQEFVEHLIPVANRGHPLGDDEVRSRQDRPSQRAILAEAAVTGDGYKRSWSAFVKKETYQKPTDPRNISIAAPATKLAYSRFQYAFTDGPMAEQDWYAFNKTPADIADRVCTVLSEALWSVIADGNRFDGHVRRRARILERMAMLRFFAREYHSRLNEAMDEQIALPGATEHGRKYNSGFGRGSGSLETANFNSLVTAFIGYCAQRNTTVNGVRKSPDQAWAALGIYGGDDSLEGDVDANALKNSAELMGQDYEIEIVLRGDVGVNFLNRQFGPNVWSGDPNSMANPSRLLSKLWVGPAHLPQPLVRFGERLSGYYRMDRNSPVIGPITEVAHELLGEQVEGTLMPYFGECSAETNWPNEDSGWMQDLFEQFIPDFDFARFRGWIKLLRERRDPELLLRAPLCTSAGIAEPVIVKKVCIVGDALELPKAKAQLIESESRDGLSSEDDGAGVGMHLPLRDESSSSSEGEVSPTPRVDPPTSPVVSSPPAKAPAPRIIEEDEQRVVVDMGGQVRVQLGSLYEEAEDAVIGPPQRREVGRFAPAAPRPQSSKKARSPSPRVEKSPREKTGRIDPRDWQAPARGKDEAERAYKDRLRKWETVRTRVAKRLGVKLTTAPAKGGAGKQ